MPEMVVRNIMKNSVARKIARGSGSRRWSQAALYGDDGERKYLNCAERARTLAVARQLPPEKSLFIAVLAFSGARVSEVLALTPASFQVDHATVAITTLKRRRFVVREVPLPPELVRKLDRHFQLTGRQRDPARAGGRLWPWCRVTAWRFVKSVTGQASIDGRRASPRGFRHGFGVGTLQAGVPLNLVQKWLGHAQISTTAIYADALGPEERMFAERFWGVSPCGD